MSNRNLDKFLDNFIIVNKSSIYHSADQTAIETAVFFRWIGTKQDQQNHDNTFFYVASGLIHTDYLKKWNNGDYYVNLLCWFYDNLKDETIACGQEESVFHQDNTRVYRM